MSWSLRAAESSSADDVALLDLLALGDDPDDRRLALDVAVDVGGPGSLDVTAARHGELQLAGLHLAGRAHRRHGHPVPVWPPGPGPPGRSRSPSHSTPEAVAPATTRTVATFHHCVIVMVRRTPSASVTADPRTRRADRGESHGGGCRGFQQGRGDGDGGDLEGPHHGERAQLRGDAAADAADRGGGRGRATAGVLTVPTGQPRCRAACSWVRPSRSQSTTGDRYRSGSRSISSCSSRSSSTSRSGRASSLRRSAARRSSRRWRAAVARAQVAVR